MCNQNKFSGLYLYKPLSDGTETDVQYQDPCGNELFLSVSEYKIRGYTPYIEDLPYYEEFILNKLIDSLRKAAKESRKLNFPADVIENIINGDKNNVLSKLSNLICSGKIQNGFKNMLKQGRKDLTIEGIILSIPEYRDLFKKNVLDSAEFRLNNWQSI